MKQRAILFVLCVYVPIHAASYDAWKADQAYLKGDFLQARSLYEDAVVSDPADMPALYNVGKTAYKQKDYAAALAAFEKVAHSSQATPALKEQSFFNQGDTLFMEKDYLRALAAYEEVLKLNSANEHAKKRIELVKKMLEEQKKNQEQQNDQDKSDKDKSDKNDKKDQQSKNQDEKQKQGSDKSKDPSEKDQSSKDMNQAPQQGGQNSKDHDNGQKEQTR